MNRLVRYSRGARLAVVSVTRFACLMLSAVIVGCSALVGPDVPSAGIQYDLSGRMRIKSEESILRLDFYMVYDGSRTRLEVWGPFGIGRTKITFAREHYTVEDHRGNVVVLRRSDIPVELPQSVWQVGPDLGPWLRLRPEGVSYPESGEAWSHDSVSVVVEEHQAVDGEQVCKRLRMTRGEVEVLVLCDRWRFVAH